MDSDIFGSLKKIKVRQLESTKNISTIFNEIDVAVLGMQKMDRFHFYFPSSWKDDKDWKWDLIEEIQMRYRGVISPDLFFMLRWSDEGGSKCGYLDIIKI